MPLIRPVFVVVDGQSLAVRQKKAMHITAGVDLDFALTVGSGPAFNPLLTVDVDTEAILNRASPFGALTQPILTVPGETVTDIIPVVRATTLVKVSMWTNVVFVSAGTYTLDLQKNGVTILSGAFNLKTLAALTLVNLVFTGPVTMAVGDRFTIITASSESPLTGSGLRLIFEF